MPLVDFDAARDTLYRFDFTGQNASPAPQVVADIPAFTRWVAQTLEQAGCRYGIGGYGENRNLYASKAHFGDGEEARSLHLGTDIWGPAGTTIYCPFDAAVHSFAFNDRFGDYGATIILQHRAGDGSRFYTLYGHLSLNSITGLTRNKTIVAGMPFAEFGFPEENGHWPPHLHFQLIRDVGDRAGDYPGVCKPSEREHWLANSPDPYHILKFTFGVNGL